MAAGIALLISLSYTLIAIRWPEAATPAAVPVIIIAVFLMIVQVRQSNRRA